MGIQEVRIELMETIVLQRTGCSPPDAGSGAFRQDRVRLNSSGSLAAHFQQSCHTHAAQPAVIEGDESFTYDWLLQAASSVCYELATRYRLRPGSRVALMLANSPEYLAAFYGVLLAGGVAVPISPTVESCRWQEIRDSSDLSLLITRDEDLTNREDLATVPCHHLDLTVVGDLDAKPLEVSERSGDDLAMIMYTSGSTGHPKGVMLSHRNVLANTQSILDYLPIREDDRALVILPLCLAFGSSILQTHLLAGATLVLGGSPTFPVSILQALRDQRATSLSAVPEVYAMLLRFAGLGDEPLPDLRYLAVAGGALKPELAELVAARIRPAKLYVMYGQTEATARLSYLPPDELQTRRGSIGRGIPGVQLRVTDAKGHTLPPGQPGRLMAQGENIMQGYWRDPEATAMVLRNGWLDTGDMGQVDADGYVYLQGRSNLLIKIQGQRIHPREIEDLVTAQFPGSQVIVVPYSIGGETRLALFLTPPSRAEIGPEAIRLFCREHLPRYKIPSHVEVLERLPLNDSLKVDRNALIARAGVAQRRVS